MFEQKGRQTFAGLFLFKLFIPWDPRIMRPSSINHLEEFEQIARLKPVATTVRLLNCCIDSLVVIILSLLFGLLVTFMFFSPDPDAIDTEQKLDAPRLAFFCTCVITYFCYYTLSEFIASGSTLGKLATGSYAIWQDGRPLTLKDAFLRSLYRLIPLEPFSTFGYRPWHDCFTKTLVVKKKK